MIKNIKFDSEARTSIQNGINILANAVKSTLGPNGRNVIIEQNNLPHVTKDGVTVAREITLLDSFENIGAQLIKEVASKTCTDVGDGTTTSSLLSQIIVNEGSIYINDGINPVKIKKELELAKNKVVDYIKSNSISINDNEDNIKRIATISANNDSELGELIADAISKITHDGVVVVEESKGIDTSIDVIQGMQFERGYIAPHFITDYIKNEAIVEDALILISDMKISYMRDIVPLLELTIEKNKSLLIIAEDYDGEVIHNLKMNKLENIVKVIPIKAPLYGEYRKEMLIDIAALTGGEFISYDSGMQLKDITIDKLGKCSKVISTKDTTTIIGGLGSKLEIDNRVATLRYSLKSVESPVIMDIIKKRIAKLIGGIAIIYVGGTTEIEMKERKDRIDDAIAATQAAIEEGVVVGGGITYLNASKILDDSIGSTILKKALLSPITQIIENSGEDVDPIISKINDSDNYHFGYNAKSEQFEDLYETGIIDPAKVSRIALENAVSIATLFLITNCIITNYR